MVQYGTVARFEDKEFRLNGWILLLDVRIHVKIDEFRGVSNDSMIETGDDNWS